jgi:hypothetical protein
MAAKAKTTPRKPRSSSSRSAGARPKCGLCGKTSRLTRTECCGQWICDDENKYRLFSYATNSCHRNHRRYTLCGYHFENGHDGAWQSCQTCRAGIDAEMYGYYGTNEFNFERLEKVPEFEPKRCAECNAIILLAEGGYSMSGGGYYCPECTTKRIPWAR